MNWDLIIGIVIGVTAKWVIVIIISIIKVLCENHREKKLNKALHNSSRK